MGRRWLLSAYDVQTVGGNATILDEFKSEAYDAAYNALGCVTFDCPNAIIIIINVVHEVQNKYKHKRKAKRKAKK